MDEDDRGTGNVGKRKKETSTLDELRERADGRPRSASAVQSKFGEAGVL